MKLTNHKNVRVHQTVDFRQTLDIIGDSKIVLNVMPWFKDGSHERIFCTMLNLLSAVAKDERYKQVYEESEGTVKNMREVADRFEAFV